MAEYTQEDREFAAHVLDIIKYDVVNRHLYWANDRETKALDTAIACLRSPGASPDVDGKAGGWVRTSERMPTEEDADDDGYIPVLIRGMFTGGMIRIMLHYKKVNAYTTEYFLPLPALPEVEP